MTKTKEDLYLVAELGVNWLDLEHAFHMINSCASIGFNAVKFQCYKEEHVARHPRKDDLMRIQVTPAHVEMFSTYAHHPNIDIDLIVTPFYPEIVPEIAEFVDRFKVRYADRDNTELLDAIAETGKPVIISAAIPLDSIYYMRFKREDVKFLFCQPDYPPREARIPLQWRVFDGLSNHVPSLFAPLMAIETGARIIEMHVKDSYYHDAPAIDDAVSFTLNECADFMVSVGAIEYMKRRK